MSLNYVEKNRIVIATPADGGQVCALAARAGVFSPEEVQCVVEIWQEYVTLGAETSGYIFYVEKAAERVLGFACVGPRSLTDRVYDLYWITVDPSARRLGVGRRLLQTAEQAVRVQSGRIMVIETSGTEKYAGTRAFYLSAGYLHAATLRDLYADGDDLWIFTKRL
jgi:ribosomal protein S18 acetylase RimI-like enzyme